MTHDLEPGDFLYQSDQELFLCVTNVTDDEVQFAVHGWRNIGKDRLDDYINDSRSRVYNENIEDALGDGDETKTQLNQLKQLFSVYSNADLPDDGPNDEFAMEES
jgi:hypothetical protein